MAGPLLTVTEVAEILKVNAQTVRNWIDHGELPTVRIERNLRIRQADLDQFIGAGRTAPAAADTPDPSALADRLARLEARVDQLAAALDQLARR